MNKNKGFTLIELLIVIAIIGVLTTLVTSNLTLAQARARDARRISDLDSIAAGLEMYYNENNTYPMYGGSAGQLSFGSALTDPSTGSNTYIKTVPSDPRNLTGFEYYYCVIGTTNSAPFRKFNLYATLENTADPRKFCGVSGASAWSTVTCDVQPVTGSVTVQCSNGSNGTSTSGALSTVQTSTNYTKSEP